MMIHHQIDNALYNELSVSAAHAGATPHAIAHLQIYYEYLREINLTLEELGK